MPDVPGPEVTRRRSEVAAAGHRGEKGLGAVGAALSDPAPAVRATALEALVRIGEPGAGDLADYLSDGMSDPAPVVRARAAELAGRSGVVTRDRAAGLAARLVALLEDREAAVVEAACFGLGELGEAAVETPEVTAGLARVSSGHGDPLCRESAVAALGAIADRAGLEAVLAAMADKPAVRRRAVLALAAFDGPEVEAALEKALSDRDRQVRQAAEDLTDRRAP